MVVTFIQAAKADNRLLLEHGCHLCRRGQRGDRLPMYQLNF